MPIQGNIEEAGLPDVLQLLALGRKSGCLTVADGELQGQIFLDVGRISYATVANRLERLGEMLVKNGRLTQQQLDAAIEEQRRTSNRQLGRILVDSGRIDRAELERFIRLQVEEAVYFLFTWKQGTFTFTSDRLPPHQPLLVSLDAETLLLEGARRVDEWSLIEKKIPSFDLVYRRTREDLGATADGLTEEQRRILPLVDGECNVTGLVDDTGLGEFEVGKALYGLLTAGLIQLVERRSTIRHLEYRELLAYSVKEAEFADPQRRRDAARHILDCATCADRLRNIHVRTTRTTTGPATEAAAEPPAMPQPARSPAPARPAPPARKSEEAASAILERRAQNRRAGQDRRQSDRRSGFDRRAAAGSHAPPSSPVGPGHRVAARREEDRRTYARDRRGSGFIPRPAAAAAAEASPLHRVTEPRQLPPIQQEVEQLPPAAGAAHAGSAIELPPWPPALADLVLEESDERERPAAAAAPVAAEEAPAPTPAPPGPKLATTPKEELDWLVSPSESLDMIRAAQTKLRAAASAAAPRPPAAAAAPRAREPAGRPAAVAAGLPIAGAAGEWGRKIGLRYSPSQGGEATSGSGGRAQSARRLPVGGLTTAAAIAAMALVGYVAGHGVGAPRAGRPAETAGASVAVRSPGGASQAPREAGGAGGEQPAKAPAMPLLAAPRVGEPTPPRAEPRPAQRAPAVEPRRPAAQSAAASAAPAQVAAAPPPSPAAPPPPTVGIVRGVVHDAGGRAVPGAKVIVRGTSLSAQADGTGAFEIQDVPAGPATVQASADGFVAASAQVQALAGGSVATTLTLSRPATAAEPDSELAAGGWIRVARDDATSALGGTLGVVPGLPVESMTKSAAGSRARVRVAQLTSSGERIVLIETRAGADVRGGSGPAVVTSIRVLPASEAYPWSTGTVSFGNILITAKTHIGADQLRSYLGKVSEAPAVE